MYFRFLSTLIFLVFAGTVSAQSPVGLWKTVDDKTGESKSHMEIYEKDGKLYGKVAKLLQRPADTVCEKCPSKKQNKPLVGMVLLEGLVPYKDYWHKGTILDPESGNEYSCSIWLEKSNPAELKVRGKHWTGLYRTQTWYRVK